jgi:hypothetical protein
VKLRIILSTKLSLFILGLLLTTKFLKETGFILTTVEMCAPTGVHVYMRKTSLASRFEAIHSIGGVKRVSSTLSTSSGQASLNIPLDYNN